MKKEPIEMTPATAASEGGQAGPVAVQAPPMIKVSKRIAAALRIGIEQANAAVAAVHAAEDRLHQAKLGLQAVAGTNQGYVAALIEDGGFKLEDFANFGIWEDSGQSYIRAAPVGK